MDPVLDVCEREPIMDPVLDVFVREPSMDPLLDVCEIESLSWTQALMFVR
jgi:hypothetical protein